MLETTPIVIMGANASGKSSLALSLAKEINGEIVSADSRQVYKHLEYGTAKPSGHWQKEKDKNFFYSNQIPYHLVDYIDPKITYSVSTFLNDFNEIKNDIFKRKKNLIIAGGTGLYINAIFNGLDPLPQSDPKLRKELLELSEKEGKKVLYEKLKKLDPLSAEKIPEGNIHRVIRAIEISLLSGYPASSLMSGNFMKDITEKNGIFIYLKWDKKLLKKRIKLRTEKVFDDWVKETQNLISLNYPLDCPGLKILGYPSIINFINGEISKEQTISEIVSLSMAYAKRQNTWFSRYKKSILLEFKEENDYNIEVLTNKIFSEIITNKN